MIKTTLIVFGLLLCMSQPVCAGENWQMQINIGLQNAVSMLTVGQAADASDEKDGKYDVRALLAGDIIAYIVIGDVAHWSDVRAACAGLPCTKKWSVHVESELAGKTVTITWRSDSVPADMDAFIVDVVTGDVVDMKKQSSLTYRNEGKKEYHVEVRK